MSLRLLIIPFFSVLQSLLKSCTHLCFTTGHSSSLTDSNTPACLVRSLCTSLVRHCTCHAFFRARKAIALTFVLLDSLEKDGSHCHFLTEMEMSFLWLICIKNWYWKISGALLCQKTAKLTIPGLCHALPACTVVKTPSKVCRWFWYLI